METLNKAYEAAKPVVSDVIKGSADFVREVADETKPEKREDADHSST